MLFSGCQMLTHFLFVHFIAACSFLSILFDFWLIISESQLGRAKGRQIKQVHPEYQLPRAAILRHQVGALQQQGFIVSQSWRLDIQDQGVSKIGSF